MKISLISVLTATVKIFKNSNDALLWYKWKYTKYKLTSKNYYSYFVQELTYSKIGKSIDKTISFSELNLE